MTSNQQIEYAAGAETDRLDQSVQTGWERRNSTLARRLIRPKVYELMFHANIKVTPKEDGRDATWQYRMLRVRRVWQGKLVGQVPSDYQLVKAGRDVLLPPGFHSDSNLDYFGDTSGHWSDTPLQYYADGKHVNESLMQEFVVGIGYLNKARAPVPEFGGLYFLVVIDIAPDRYRVLMSLEKRLSGPEILGVFRAQGGVCPPYLANAVRPDLASFRYKLHDWVSFKEHLA